jgi:hypothetical protein
MNLTHQGPRAVAAVILGFVALAFAFAAPYVLDDAPEEPVSTEPIRANASNPDDDEVALADGSYFGRIVAAYVAPGEIVFDRRELLVGDQARAAAADRREVTDFAIRDTGLPRLVLPTADTTIVTRVECGDGGCAQGRPQTYDEFSRSFAETFETAGERWFQVLVDDGIVVRIDEQYFP